MPRAPREIELKFRAAPEDLDAALAAAPAGEEETRELTSVYFDTPDGAVARAAASLRIRESGPGRVQTLKLGRGVAREEHEAPAAGERPDLPALRRLLAEDQMAALAPVLEVRIRRRQRLVRFEGAEIEIAADVGETRANGRAAPICELELELKSGPWRALFALARRLRRVARLELSFESKSDQGRRLLQG